MAGTMAGGRAAAKTNKEKHDEYYKREYGMTFYQYIGSVGGKRGHTGGFYKNSELARIAGAKGGKISKRRKNG